MTIVKNNEVKAPNAAESKAAIVKMIADCVKTTTTLQSQIQKAGIAILLHAYNHADYSLANTLIADLGEGVRKQALVSWFETYGGFIVDETDQAKGFTSWKKPAFIEKNLDKAKQTKWWTCKPQPAFKGFDFNTKLEQMLTQAKKQLQNKIALEKSDKAEDKAKAELIAVSAEQVKMLADLVGTKAAEVQPIKAKDAAPQQQKRAVKTAKAA